MALLLDHRTQSAVHRLLMVEPERGALLPAPALDAVRQLVGSDRFGIIEGDRSGFCLRSVLWPGDEDDPTGTQVCDRALPTGLVHQAALPSDEQAGREFGYCDVVQLGVATASGTVVQLFFDRRRRYFDERDLAMLRMVEPAIRRLVRESAGPPRPGLLSPSEREVLALVSTGASNREVAEELFVTVHTVRKHLENAYRKLGVTNRTAAALRLRQ